MEALGSRLRDPKTAIPHLLVEALMAEGLSWHRPAQGTGHGSTTWRGLLGASKSQG